MFFWLLILTKQGCTLVVKGSIYSWSNLFPNFALRANFFSSIGWLFSILHNDFFNDGSVKAAINLLRGWEQIGSLECFFPL